MSSNLVLRMSFVQIITSFQANLKITIKFDSEIFNFAHLTTVLNDILI